MSQRDEVYTITDDVGLDSIRREMERRGALRPGGAEASGERPRSDSGRQRVRYAQPPPSGARALWASTLSMFVCGAGQLYNGQGKLAALLLLTQSLFVAANWCLMRVWAEAKDLADLFGVTDLQVFATVAALDFLMVFVVMASVYQAYREAERRDGPFSGRDNPLASALASMVVPGWGQLVNAQPVKAMVFLFCFLSALYAFALLAFTPLLPLLDEVRAWRTLSAELRDGLLLVPAVAAVFWLLSVYDAALVAGFRRRMS